MVMQNPIDGYNDLYLYDNLRIDRTTAAHGLEVRVPKEGFSMVCPQRQSHGSKLLQEQFEDKVRLQEKCVETSSIMTY